MRRQFWWREEVSLRYPTHALPYLFSLGQRLLKKVHVGVFILHTKFKKTSFLLLFGLQICYSLSKMIINSRLFMIAQQLYNSTHGVLYIWAAAEFLQHVVRVFLRSSDWSLATRTKIHTFDRLTIAFLIVVVAQTAWKSDSQSILKVGDTIFTKSHSSIENDSLQKEFSCCRLHWLNESGWSVEMRYCFIQARNIIDVYSVSIFIVTTILM